MVSNNLRRDWIEVGVHATLSKAYGLVTRILVVDLIICVALIFFPLPAAIGTFFMGISVGLLIFTVASVCTVKADKISREWA